MVGLILDARVLAGILDAVYVVSMVYVFCHDKLNSHSITSPTRRRSSSWPAEAGSMSVSMRCLCESGYLVLMLDV